MKKYYVDIIDGKRKQLLFGPFDNHDDADRLINFARAVVPFLNPGYYFAKYGTCSIESEKTEDFKSGVLNNITLERLFNFLKDK